MRVPCLANARVLYFSISANVRSDLLVLVLFRKFLAFCGEAPSLHPLWMAGGRAELKLILRDMISSQIPDLMRDIVIYIDLKAASKPRQSRATLQDMPRHARLCPLQ